MNIDRFGESIRRKLESIRPDYTERDWARMQATLQQAQLQSKGAAEPVVRPLWANRTVWLAAATISTVVLFAQNVWQRHTISELRNSVRALSQTTATTPARSASPSSTELPPADRPTSVVESSGRTRDVQPTDRVDTVYITRYVPMSSSPSTEAVERPVIVRQHSAKAADTYTHTETPAYDKTITSRQLNSGIASIPPRAVPAGSGNSVAPSSPNSQRESATYDSRRETVPGQNGQPSATDQPTGAVAEAVRVETLASKVMQPESVDWGRVLNRRARPLREQAVVAAVQTNQTAPESQPVVTPVQIRVGVGSDINRSTWSMGVVSEFAIGKNWIVGLGLSRSNQLVGQFMTDFDFNTRTRRDFRREFARGLDPRRDVLNIDVRQIQLQIPLSLSYRIPLNPSLALLPSVGTYITLGNRETVSFYYREAFNKFDEARFSDNRPVELMNSYTLGTNLEWQQGHWAVQAGPLLTVPLKTNQRWDASTALGARLRVMYVF